MVPLPKGPSGGPFRLNDFTGFTYFILVPTCNHSFFGNESHLRLLLELSRITRIKELIQFFNFLAYGKYLFLSFFIYFLNLSLQNCFLNFGIYVSIYRHIPILLILSLIFLNFCVWSDHYSGYYLSE